LKQANQCLKCGSKDAIKGHARSDRTDGGHPVAVATYLDPAAMVFKNEKFTRMSAWICAECGFVEFFADSPKALRGK